MLDQLTWRHFQKDDKSRFKTGYSSYDHGDSGNPIWTYLTHDGRYTKHPGKTPAEAQAVLLSIVQGGIGEWEKKLEEGKMSERLGCLMISTELTKTILNWIKSRALTDH